MTDRTNTHHLTYWVAIHLTDSNVYSIRGRTRREVRRVLGAPSGATAQLYTEPRKVTVEYTDAFSILEQCSWEGRMFWEGYPGDDRDGAKVPDRFGGRGDDAIQEGA